MKKIRLEDALKDEYGEDNLSDVMEILNRFTDDKIGSEIDFDYEL
jgi:hypothetical protein